jgi:Protein of unknown function (DUF1573)
MKRHPQAVILALCAILSLVAAVSGFAADNGKPHGKAVVVEPIKDVGTVAKSDKVSHDFEIRNDGTVALNITDVKAACGCTVVSYDKTVAPGKIGKVHVIVDTTSFTGPIAKGVTVFTDDPGNPQIALTIRAKVEPYIAVKPGYARFVTVRGEAKEGDVVQTLWAPDAGPMDIVKVDSPFPWITVKFHEAQEGERLPDIKVKQWRVDIILSNDAPVGPIAAMVAVHTTHAKQKLVEIPVSGFIRPVIAVTPPTADMGKFEVKEAIHRSFDVRNFATEPIKVIGVDPLGPGIEANVQALEEGREYSLRLTISPNVPKGPLHTKLVLHTDSPRLPIVEVELNGTVL